MPADVERLLVVGCKGMLGTDLMDALARAWPRAERLGLDLPDIDITRPDSVRRCLAGFRPQVVFNCAGYTNVDRCESEPDLARAVNGEGPGHLACAARDAGAVLLHVSTDFVFDGERRAPYVEDDAPNPLSVYGRSKLAGDRGVAAAGGRWVIARTAWLYGRNGRNFVDTMLRLAREGKDLSVVTDRVGSPTWTRDLAGAIVALIRADARGIYNAVNRGACSRYEQVLEIVRLAGLAVRVNPVDSRAFPRPAATPAYSALDVSRLARDTGHVMRPWQQALRDYLTHVP